MFKRWHENDRRHENRDREIVAEVLSNYRTSFTDEEVVDNYSEIMNGL
jgi:uncharacterized protein YutD